MPVKLGPMPSGVWEQDHNTMPRITSLWACLSVDPKDGNEGVCAVNTADGWLPLIAADETRLEWVIQEAQHLASDNNMTIRIARFTVREDIKELKP